MLAVLRREFKSYFTSPIGYVFIAVAYVVAGVFFYLSNILSNSNDMSGVFSSFFLFTLLFVPLLTMRMWADERRLKTDQALLTAPVSLFALMMGKYLAAVLVYALAISISLVFALIVSVTAVANWAMIIGSFVGTLLFGACVIAIGMFISSLTESQLVSAIGSLFVSLALWMIDSIASIMPTNFLKQAVGSLSFYSRYNDFAVGILDLANIFFFVSVCAVFVFLTIRVFEKRRWG
ncbi:MAG: ABC transporter permease [Oscillospiraceae bacterium]|nr:ABC transporter permease subunit [Oscillospiraceae bacterium]MDY4191968.1 ABC transporter permease [Oscillospiraceae bacterium]